jgi:hypothetical protein
VALGPWSCAVPGFDLVDSAPSGLGGGAGGAGGADATGGAGGGGGSGDPCRSAYWPPPPSASDPGPDDVEIVVALRKVDLGEGKLDKGPEVGFDLDGLCSCCGEGASCKEPDAANIDRCDGPCGRDNSTARMFAAATAFSKNLSSVYQSGEAEKGNWSLVIRIRGYNGKPNDKQVTVSLHPSPGYDKDPCYSGGGGPKWDGTDRWPLEASSFDGLPTSGAGGGGGAGGEPFGVVAVGGCGAGEPPSKLYDQAKYLDANGYVTGSVLVANLPSIPILLQTDTKSVPFDIKGGALSGKLVEEPDGWHLREASLAGRWPVTSVLEVVGSVTSMGVPLCTDHPLYGPIKSGVCGFRDIHTDVVGPTTPCNAISFGAALEAAPIRLGVIYLSATEGASCPPGKDPADDKCD